MTTQLRDGGVTTRSRDRAGRLHDCAALVDELRGLATSDDINRTLFRSAQLAGDAARCRRPVTLVAELSAFAGGGTYAGVLGIELLAAVDHPAAGDSLAALLTGSDQLLRRHAAWRLRRGRRVPAAVSPLLDMLVTGGIDTMHAHRTLRHWAVSDRDVTDLALARLHATGGDRQRARLLDLLGVIDDPRSAGLIVEIAGDPAEPGSARIAAIRALSARHAAGGASDAVLRRIANTDDEVGAHATLTLCERQRTPVGPNRRSGGLRVAQLTMAAGLDRELNMGGRGEVGGVASLLVSLAEALARRPGIDHVLTIGRGTVTEAIAAANSLGDTTSSFATIAIGDEGRPVTTTDDFWEHLPTIERGVRHAVGSGRGVDLLHLRMADAGTLAGVHTAAALGIATCFSLAPDPHNVLAALRPRGDSGHAAVVRLAADGHIWFRARLVERLARESDRVALFPREAIDFFPGVGSARSRSGQRVALIAEGIDVALIGEAEAAACSVRAIDPRCNDVLADLASAVPAGRRHLPLLVSVGRLNPVKGMDRIVAAWLNDPLLHARCNLVIVGGDLAAPSVVERSVLTAIERLAPEGDPRRSGLVLLGGRPPRMSPGCWSPRRVGRVGNWPAGGVYVDGAWKEEFGLAVIEALAAGLVVVAPSTGGPPTYIDDGDMGVLVDPDADLGHAIGRAFALVDRPGRAVRARRLIEQRYSITMMAKGLADLYGAPVADR